MTSDALFGPDGTQLPEPLPTMPDPLVAPTDSGARPPPAPPMWASRSAQDTSRDAHVTAGPAPAAPPSRALRRADGSTWASHGAQDTSRDAHMGGGPGMPGVPLPSDAVTTPPAGIPVQRPPDLARQPPVVSVRRGSGGWIGCLVVLIFLVIVVVNIVSSIVDAVGGG